MQENEEGPLFKFYEAIVDHGGDFIDHINKLTDVTLFVPSNDAWASANTANIIT